MTGATAGLLETDQEESFPGTKTLKCVTDEGDSASGTAPLVVGPRAHRRYIYSHSLTEAATAGQLPF